MLVSLAELKTFMDISLTARQEDAAEMVLAGLQSELESFLNRPVQPTTVTEEHVIPSHSAGIPGTTFMYNISLDTSGNLPNFITPSHMISLRNSPVISVLSVSVAGSVRENLFLAESIRKVATVTEASKVDDSIVFTADNSFTIGQYVRITSALPTQYNIQNLQITSVSATTFTVAYTASIDAYISGGAAIATGSDYTVHRYGVEIFAGYPNEIVTVNYSGGLDGDGIKVFKIMVLRAATREIQNMHDDTVGMKDLTTRNVAPLETGFLEKELIAMRKYRRRRIS